VNRGVSFCNNSIKSTFFLLCCKYYIVSDMQLMAFDLNLRFKLSNVNIMKKWLKIILWIIGIPAALILILLVSYIIVNKQEVIDPFQVGNPEAKYKVLIASQGSDFKENLVDRFVMELESDSVYLSILDCTQLNENYLKGWDAYVFIHTMQIHKMPEEADLFLHKMADLTKVVLVSTSGAGDEHYKNLDIDGISSASRMVAIDPIMEWILPKLEIHLKDKV